MNRLSRRTVLIGGAGALLAACSSSSSSSSGPSGSASAATTAAGDRPASPAGTTKPLAKGQFQIVQFFKPGSAPAGMPHRLPFGLGSSDGVLETGGPDAMDVKVTDVDGKAQVQPATVATRHANGVQRPYWPVTVNLPAGNYQAQFSAGGKVVGEAAFAVGGAPDLPKPGDALPVFPTSTPVNPQGVNPLCTRQPTCPLHDVSLDEVLGKGKPVALLVATPAYCQTAICGPMLDVVLANRRDGVTYIHQEVWKDTKLDTPAPLLTKYAIDYEPVLFLMKGDGIVTARLDVIWDVDDLNLAMATLA